MTQGTSQLVVGRHTCQTFRVLLIKVSLDGLFASWTLFVLMLALVELMICIAANFDDLRATSAVSQHETL